VASEVVAFAQEHNTDLVVTAESPSPRFDAICEEIKHSVPVEVLAVEPFLRRLYRSQTLLSLLESGATAFIWLAMNLFEQHRQQVAETESLLLPVYAPSLEEFIGQDHMIGPVVTSCHSS